MATTTAGASTFFSVSRLIAPCCVPVIALLLGGCYSPNTGITPDAAETEDETETGGAMMTTAESSDIPNTPTTTTGTEPTTGNGPTGDDETGGGSSPTTGDGETSEASETGSESSSEETSTEATCMGECIDIGGDWNGPVRLFEGDTPPDCEDAASPEFTAFSGLDAPAAECGCVCGSADIECPDTGSISSHGDPGAVSCGFITPVWTQDVGPGCNDIPNALEPTRVRLSVDQPADVEGATCPATPSTEIAPATWDRSWAGCGADAAVGDCDVCSTQTQDMCIWQEGDVDCDVPGFSEKTLLATDVEDGRACSTCTCGDAAGSCDADVTYRALDGCTLANVGEAGPGECLEVEFARGADVEFSGSFTCEAAEVSAVGSATPSGAITACCAA